MKKDFDLEDKEKIMKMIDSGEFDEVIGAELDREVGVTFEDMALLVNFKKTKKKWKKSSFVTNQKEEINHHRLRRWFSKPARRFLTLSSIVSP